MNRREFVKTTAVAGAALAIASRFGLGEGLLAETKPQTAAPLTGAPVTVSALVTSMGARLVHVANGRIIREIPIPVPSGAAYPNITAKGKTYTPPNHTFVGPASLAYRNYAYASNRVLYPMMRADFVPGGKGPVNTRGKGNWVRITWDQATSIIASEIKRVQTTYGPGAISLLEGSNSETTSVQGKPTWNRLMNILGGFVDVDEPTYSSAGWAYGGPFIYGYKAAKGKCDTADLFLDGLNNTDTYLLWGNNPLVTDGTPTKGESAALMQFLKSVGKRVIVVDPKYSETAQCFADTYISIIPGTDAAMLAAIAYTWIKEGTYLKDWVKTHVVGFDDSTLPAGVPSNSSFSAYILGTMDGIPKTPDWAAAICGVPARRIKALARDWASHTTMFCPNQPHRASYGYDVTRMFISLAAMQGFGRPGAQLGAFPGSLPSAGNQYSSPSVDVDSQMTKTYPNSVDPPYRVNRQLFTEFFQKGTVSFIGSELGTGATNAFTTYTMPPKGFSMVHLWFADEHSHLSARVNSNLTPLGYQSPNMEFFVQITPWWGGSELYADIVLPVCTVLEQVDMNTGSGTYKFETIHGQIIPPMGESKSDFDACTAIAQALGVDNLFNEGHTALDLLKLGFAKSSLATAMTFDQFMAAGYVYNPSKYTSSYVPKNPGMTWYYTQAVGSGLDMPTGQIEMFSTMIYKYLGFTNADVSPVPKYRPKVEGKYAPLASKYPLDLSTPHTRWRFHGQYDNINILRDCYKIIGPDGRQHEPVWMNPVDADARGIKDGDIVKVFNDRGAVLCGAKVTRVMQPGVVHIVQASWYTPADPTTPFLELNGSCNALTSNRGQSPSGTFARAVPDCSALVEITKYTG